MTIQAQPKLMRVFAVSAIVAFSLALSVTQNFAQELTLRLSHPQPKESARGYGAEFFARRMSELTNGKVKVEVFPDAELGSEAKTLAGMQTGSIDFGIISEWTNVVKAGRVFDLPFLFRDFDHWKAAVEGAPGQMAADAAKGTGVKVMGYWISGWRNIYGSKAIKESKDLAGVKIRTQPIASYVDLFKAVKAIPTPIAWGETYLALQQGTVDIAESAFEAMYNAKQYEVAKFASNSRHAISTAAFLISESRWASLPENIQRAVVTAQKEANEAQAKKFSENDTAVIGKLAAAGVKFSEFNSGEMHKIAVDQVYPKVVVEELDKKILAEIQKL